MFEEVATFLGLTRFALLYVSSVGGLVCVFLFILGRSIRTSREQSALLDRKDAELALHWRAMEAHAMMNVSDAAGRMIEVNETLTTATGYTREELLGHRVSEFLTPEENSPTAVREALELMGYWTGETKLRRKDGGVFWTRTTIMAARDRAGRLERTVSLRTDITEIKARQAEAQNRALLDRLNDEVYVFAADTLQLLYLNRRALAVQGWDTTGYGGRGLADTTEDFDAQVFRDRVAPLLAGEIEALTYESTLRSRPVEISLQLEQGYEGRARFIAVVRDISLRRQAEEARSQFVATISHELRSPLTSVLGALKLVTSGAFGTLANKPGAMLGVALRNVERLIDLINDLLDLEKLDAGRMTFAMTRLDMSSLVDEALAANSGYGDQLQVRFRRTGLRAVREIEGDRARLIQVLNNLLSNAAKFSPPGGQVEVELRDAPGVVQVLVHDHGSGIPPAAQAQLFERFAQADGTTGRRPGTGLGLSIAKSIVEHHGGSIRFTSTLDVGTTFCVEFPTPLSMSQAA